MRIIIHCAGKYLHVWIHVCIHLAKMLCCYCDIRGPVRLAGTLETESLVGPAWFLYTAHPWEVNYSVHLLIF